MDDDIFACSGPYGSMSILLQRVASLCRRAQANAPAAFYWLRHVLDNSERGEYYRRVHRAKSAGSGACNAPLFIERCHIRPIYLI